MWRRLTSKSARKHLAYAAMSLLIVWHTLAMAIASAPESAVTASARPLFHHYLTLFRLDNNWGFFAPTVELGGQFRYIVEDAAGQRHTFIPAEKLSRFLPTSIWFKDRYKDILESVDTHGQAAAAAFCLQHAALQPVAITFVELEQRDFSPADRLSGKHPLDAEFVDERVLEAIRCPAR